MLKCETVYTRCCDVCGLPMPEPESDGYLFEQTIGTKLITVVIRVQTTPCSYPSTADVCEACRKAIISQLS
jgi:hypothetical protein